MSRISWLRITARELPRRLKRKTIKASENEISHFLAFSGPSRVVNRICMSLICTCIASTLLNVKQNVAWGLKSQAKKHTPVINDPSRFLLNAMKHREGDSWNWFTANALQIDSKRKQIARRLPHKSIESFERSGSPVNESQIRNVFTEDLQLFDSKVGVFLVHGRLLCDDKCDVRSATRAHDQPFIIHHVLRVCAGSTQDIRQIEALRFCKKRFFIEHYKN